MANVARRPSFTEAWLEDVQDDLRRYGKRALVPWALLSSIGIGTCVAWLVPADTFWNKPEISMVFFTAAVTVNGLLLALSWGSFAKIYEIAAEPRMANFLRRNGLLNGYIFHVDFIHFTQIAALSCSGIALIFCVIGKIPMVEEFVSLLTLQKILLASSVAGTIYALKYAVGAVRIMQDLVWNSAHFPERSDPEIKVHEGGRDRS